MIQKSSLPWGYPELDNAPEYHTPSPGSGWYIMHAAAGPRPAPAPASSARDGEVSVVSALSVLCSQCSQCSLPIDIYWLISSSCHCCNLGRPINGRDAVCRFTQRRITARRIGLFRNLHSKFIAKWFHIVYCILGCKWLSVFKSL